MDKFVTNQPNYPTGTELKKSGARVLTMLIVLYSNYFFSQFIDKFKEVKELSRSSSTNGDTSNGSLPPSSPDVTHSSPAQVPKHNSTASSISTQVRKMSNCFPFERQGINADPKSVESHHMLQLYVPKICLRGGTICVRQMIAHDTIRSGVCAAYKCKTCVFQNDVHALERKNSGSTISSLPANASEAQLKYENDRLKIALAQRYKL